MTPDLIFLVTFATFGTVSLTAWAVLRPFGVESAVTQRLKVFVGGSAVGRVRRREGSGPLGRLVAAIGGHSVGADSSLGQRLAGGGYPGAHSAGLFRRVP